MIHRNEAEVIASALGGRKVGRGWLARCPAHDDRDPSLSIRNAEDGNVLVCCHAGCEQAAVIAALRARGLWDRNGRSRSRRAEVQSHGAGVRQQNEDGAERAKAALSIWQAAAPASGTLVESYLQSRGLHLPLPPSIRFHRGLKHPTGGVWPAMVALVTRGIDDLPLAVHRTFLMPDGRGKAPVEPQKMMLGPCRGGAVRLARCGGVLMVGEGIETCLTVMQATGRPTWAALSTSSLRGLDLPAHILEVIVLADGDEPGESAARDAAQRWKREGRLVRIARPPRGYDFNDVLLGRASRQMEGAA